MMTRTGVRGRRTLAALPIALLLLQAGEEVAKAHEDKDDDENKPLRDQPPVTNTVEGVMAIQHAFEMHDWGQQAAQTTHTWAIHLQDKPLAGVGRRLLSRAVTPARFEW